LAFHGTLMSPWTVGQIPRFYQWWSFDAFINTGALGGGAVGERSFYNNRNGVCSFQKKKWCMQGNAEVEREMELYGLGQKGGMAAETREWQSVRLCVHGKRIVCMTCLGLNGERVCGRLMNNSNYATILTSKRLWSCPPCASLSTRGFQTMTRGKCVREGLKGRCSSLKPS